MGDNVETLSSDTPPEGQTPRKFREDLQTLKDVVEPARQFEDMVTRLSGLRERVPVFKDMRPETAALVLGIFAIAIFQHTLDRRRGEAKISRDEAETEKLKAEAEKARLEAEAIKRDFSTSNADYQSANGQGSDAEQSSDIAQSALVQAAAAADEVTEKPHEQFMDDKQASKLQTSLQHAAQIDLRENGTLSDTESSDLSHDIHLYVDDTGSLVIDFTTALQEKVAELKENGKEVDLAKLLSAAPSTVNELGRETFYRVKFSASDESARYRFNKIIAALEIES